VVSYPLPLAWNGIAAAVLALAAPAPVLATPPPGAWGLELSTGSAYSFRTRLSLRQSGFEEVRLRGRYETRPFEDAPYYSVRLSWWRGGGGWEVELLHHKVYLANPPAEVQSFQVSHGYNLLTLAHAWPRRSWVLRAGGGIVIAHPESRVRGASGPVTGGLLDTGYFLTGPAFEVGVGRRWHLGRWAFLATEGSLTLARARVPIAVGDATVPNAALHARVGLGLGRRP
jgi:hypothetical protein